MCCDRAAIAKRFKICRVFGNHCLPRRILTEMNTRKRSASNRRGNSHTVTPLPPQPPSMRGAPRRRVTSRVENARLLKRIYHELFKGSYNHSAILLLATLQPTILIPCQIQVPLPLSTGGKEEGHNARHPPVPVVHVEAISREACKEATPIIRVRRKHRLVKILCRDHNLWMRV